MYEVPCLDINWNTINKFYQWDVDQKIEALKVELMGLINRASTDTKTETKDEPSAPETDTTADGSGTTDSSAE